VAVARTHKSTPHQPIIPKTTAAKIAIGKICVMDFGKSLRFFSA